MPDATDGAADPSGPSASVAIPETKAELVEDGVRRILEKEARIAPKDLERVSHQIATVTLAAWSGPLPPPAVLREYEDIVPGCATDIVEAFTGEVAHRQEMERKTLTLMSWGMGLGFIALLAMLGIAAYALTCGYPAVAGTIATVMTGVIGLFIWKQQEAPKPKPEQPRPGTPGNRAARRAADASAKAGK
jgi:uncharacterized membrane protein